MPSRKTCKSCGKETRNIQAKYCSECNAPFPSVAAPTTPVADASRILCPQCSEPNLTSAKFCKKCGKELTPLISHVTPIVVVPIVSDESNKENATVEEQGTPRPVVTKTTVKTVKPKAVEPEPVVETVKTKTVTEKPADTDKDHNDHRSFPWLWLLIGVLAILLLLSLLRSCDSVPSLRGVFSGTSSEATLAPKATSVPATTTSVPTTQPAVPQGQTDLNTDGSVHMFVLNPSASSQQQNRHPVAYQETKVSGVSVTFVIDVPANHTGIIGGYNIDGVDKGVYRAFGPGHYTFSITDGFALIVENNWAQAEWDFRLGQAIDFNWAHAHVDAGPLVLK